ncbi:MAG: putative thiol peroxidase [Thermodesulfobacteriota bacterium]|nr:MAG: putative thiol peroxidase [Thermodesulfobacteriota bacterium]
MAEERTGVVTLKGNPLTLIGPEVKVGDKAPDFSSLKGLGAPITLADMEGKVKVFNVIISVDTPVCDVQTKRFNEEAANLGDDVEILTLSMDLPFALGRYCAAAGIDKVKTASDYKDASFGEAYGVLIKEHRLLARALFVVDKDDVVRYAEYVPEVATEPNYDPAIAAVKESL